MANRVLPVSTAYIPRQTDWLADYVLPTQLAIWMKKVLTGCLLLLY